MNMDLTSFCRMHGLVEDLRRKCVIEYWEQRNADDPLAQFGPRLLNHLSAILRNEPCSLHDVMRHTGLSAPAASAFVAKLVRAGILRREVNPQNRRSVLITVEPEFRRSLAEIDAKFKEHVMELFRSATTAEQEALETVGEFLNRLLEPKETESC